MELKEYYKSTSDPSLLDPNAENSLLLLATEYKESTKSEAWNFSFVTRDKYKEFSVRTNAEGSDLWL